MVRWRYFLVLALLLLIPVKTDAKVDEDDDDENLNDGPDTNADPGKNDDSDEDDDDDDDDDDDTAEKSEPTSGRRADYTTVSTTTATRTEKKRSLECYVCAFKSETPMRSCLDPTKYRVHTLTCHNPGDKCFTSIISKKDSYEAVVRGCRSNCVGTPDTTCCEFNRCNNQALAMPIPVPKALASAQASGSEKTIPPTVLFFVTILLVLQTVVRVAVV